MSIAELQTDLIRLIIATEDKAFLRQLIEFIKSYKSKPDWWDELSDYEREMIATGVKELDEGRGIPYEQVRAEINQILKKN